MDEKEKQKRQPQSWRHWHGLRLGFVLLVIFLLGTFISEAPPHFSTHMAQSTLRATFILFTGLLGILFLGYGQLNPMMHIPSIIISVFVLAFVIDLLGKYRIGKVLLALIILVNMSCGVLYLSLVHYIPKLDASCGYNISDEVQIRIDDYFIYTRLGGWARNTFYLVTYDEGSTWQQLHYVNTPIFQYVCKDDSIMGIEIIDDYNITINLFRNVSYISTTDGGLTWQLDEEAS